MYSNALKQYRAFRRDETVVNTDDIKTALQNESISETERQELIKARVGQGQFRKKVLQKYESRCIITGIDNPRLLLASHIKPWAVSSNAERLNSENGLCLSPAYDRLFDIGLISFSQKGQLRISSQLGVQNAKRLYIQAGMQFDLKYTPEGLSQILCNHREVVKNRVKILKGGSGISCCRLVYKITAVNGHVKGGGVSLHSS